MTVLPARGAKIGERGLSERACVRRAWAEALCPASASMRAEISQLRQSLRSRANASSIARAASASRR